MMTSTAPMFPASTLSGGDVEDDYEVYDWTYSMKIEYFLALKLAVCVLGLVGNALTLRAFLKIGLEDNVTIVFFHLAVSDLNLVHTYLARIGASLSEYAPLNVFSTFQVHPYAIIYVCTSVGAVFINVSLYLTTFLALQRCLCVVKPLQFKAIFTRFRTSVIITAIWCVSLSMSLVSYFFYHLEEVERTDNNSSWISFVFEDTWNSYVSKAELVYGLINGSCQMIIVVSIVLMANALKRSAAFRQTAATNPDSSAADQKHDTRGPGQLEGAKSPKKIAISYKERQVILQVTLVSAIVFISHTHNLVFELVWILYPGIYLAPGFWNRYDIYQEIRNLLYLLNSSLNIFIYYRFNSNFRRVCFQSQAKKAITSS